MQEIAVKMVKFIELLKDLGQENLWMTMRKVGLKTKNIAYHYQNPMEFILK